MLKKFLLISVTSLFLFAILPFNSINAWTEINFGNSLNTSAATASAQRDTSSTSLYTKHRVSQNNWEGGARIVDKNNQGNSKNDYAYCVMGVVNTAKVEMDWRINTQYFYSSAYHPELSR